jgi:hypothetical protein
MLRLLVCWIALASLPVALAAPVTAAGVIPVKPAATASELAASERDVLLTLQCRRELALDPELAPLNLGVRIRNRIATLWGQVPSAELSFKAEVCLRGLIELLEVRNDLWVTGENLPVRAPVASPPPAYLPAPPPPMLPGLPAATIPPPVPVRPAPPRVTPATNGEVELPPLRLPQPKQH